MCGICGMVDFSGAALDEAALRAMRDEMQRRGPDDAGLLVRGPVGLGHRRLSIIDLSPRGHQPMETVDGRTAIVFNGEIYNYRPLREELVREGAAFRSDSDTEVLLHGYRAWGLTGLLERINGMFAFGLWDEDRGELHLARDRTGKKPLFFAGGGVRFAFASEIKALRRASSGAWRLRPEAMARFLYWGWIPGEETIFQEVTALLPGHWMTVGRGGGRRPTRYWNVSFARKTTLSVDEIIERTDAVLGDAVARRLHADVPLGAFLSGGVDSAYVVSQMAARSQRRVRTFSIGFNDDFHDERRHARAVAEHVGTEHTEEVVRPDAWSILPKLVWECGQPFGDAAIVPTYYVSEATRRRVTVALTGDGGDESFGGYSQHEGRMRGARLGRLAPEWVLRRALAAAAGVIDSGRRTKAASAARFVRYASTDPLLNWAAVKNWSLHHLRHFWAPAHRSLADPELLIGYGRRVMGEFDGDDALDRALYFDLNVQLPFAYNVKVDVASMMHSLEARSPFLDREVIEWAAALPRECKIRGSERKWVLKLLAARRVPREIVYRPKHGFSVPIDDWFRGAWAAAAGEIVLGRTALGRGYFNEAYLRRLWDDHRSGRSNHGTRFWFLLWLEIWHRQFVDGTMTGEDALPAL